MKVTGDQVTLALTSQWRRNKLLVLFCIALLLTSALADLSKAQETAAYFKANCASCHTDLPPLVEPVRIYRAAASLRGGVAGTK
jgi:mono/diheme cytochrome c family protein